MHRAILTAPGERTAAAAETKDRRGLDRPEGMSRSILLVCIAALFLLALTGALVELVRGRRPALVARPTPTAA
jgi:hypothetical protein